MIKTAILCAVLVFTATLAAFGATLSWDAPTTLADGRPIPSGETITYNVYRGNRSDGSDLTLLNTSPITGLSYVDNTVVPNRVYYYVATAVRVLNNRESVKSNVAVADLYSTSNPKNLSESP